MKDARWSVDKDGLKHKENHYKIPKACILSADWIDGFVTDKKWLDEVDVEQLKKHQADFAKKADKAAAKEEETADAGENSETVEAGSETTDGEVSEGGSDETEVAEEEGSPQEVPGDAPVSGEEPAVSV